MATLDCFYFASLPLDTPNGTKTYILLERKKEGYAHVQMEDHYMHISLEICFPINAVQIQNRTEMFAHLFVLHNIIHTISYTT